MNVLFKHEHNLFLQMLFLDHSNRNVCLCVFVFASLILKKQCCLLLFHLRLDFRLLGEGYFRSVFGFRIYHFIRIFLFL